ncbi:hypothetical protein CVT26_016015 [Gymnopilus dilepis]|uniref:Uncharacterized protein n=1 Tax=Gymnopilus dilepis TaxID=231916 RepID=A0A409YDK0_9AGAR|nr:hypothetical protein CVT26_016015 [Gymnopilus dilepis]
MANRRALVQKFRKLVREMRGAAQRVGIRRSRVSTPVGELPRDPPSRESSEAAPSPDMEIPAGPETYVQIPPSSQAYHAGSPSVGAQHIHAPYPVSASNMQDSFNITRSTISRMNTYHTYHTHYHYHFIPKSDEAKANGKKHARNMSDDRHTI